METFPSFLSTDPLICPETDEESLFEKGFGDLQESRENVVLLVGKHVSAARAQEEFAQCKVDAADETLDEIIPSKKTVTIVMDFCQNLNLSHLGGEQPGDTYYYSPVWLYCLGIYDVSEDRLYDKNGTIIKMAAFFVERGWFRKVNIIFLVKGHTKNVV